MKNGKHTIIRLIRSIRGQKKQTYSLPFREGLGVNFLTPFLSGRGRGVGFSPREARLTHKMGVSGFQVQDTHNASYFSKMLWSGYNLSDGKVG